MSVYAILQLLYVSSLHSIICVDTYLHEEPESLCSLKETCIEDCTLQEKTTGQFYQYTQTEST